MKKLAVTIVAAFIVVSVVLIAAWSQTVPTRIVSVAPEQINWLTPAYYKDDRQRAKIYGNSDEDGPWIDRVKIPAGLRVGAHTHPQDEYVTVIEGTWYVGEGSKFDPDKLKAYPAGSFVLIPAGLPHFVATKDSAVIIQLSGNRKFSSNYLEK